MEKIYFNLRKWGGKYTGWTQEEGTKSQGEKSASYTAGVGNPGNKTKK